MARLWQQHPQVITVSWFKSDRLKRLLLQGCSTLLGWCLISNPLFAQVTPDDSLGTEVDTNNNVSEITGGTQSDRNLFHSFQEFSLENGDTAFFNNSVDISNIISRVTGGNISNLDGLIRANGDANLILINPNGITLGSNATLDIGGSFLGSTAESLIFEDGTVFHTDLNTPPLLTISTPVGLQLGQNSAPIQVSGRADSNPGLALTAGNTFALVGNGVTFDGATVTAESGRIDISSVESGQVTITEIAAGWQLGVAGITQLGELQLLNRSALLNPNLSANSTGGIQLQGNNITLERSQIAAETLADAPGGNILINASESLNLSGVAEIGENSSQISNNVLSGATGAGGTIEITTGELHINPRSFIDNSIFGEGSAGDIKIAATAININGAGFLEFQEQYRLDALTGDLQPGSRITGIFAGTATTGTAGNIEITTDSLNLTNGAIIFTPVFTAGNGGNINIEATDIQVDASAIQNGGGIASTETASLGEINLNSDRLTVENGGTVINLTFGNVPGGNINITSEAIALSNTPAESVVATGLITNTTLGSGVGGDLTVDAQNITIDNASISSNSGGLLPDGTLIPAGGLGGNINIQASESIEASGIIFSADDSPVSLGAGIGTRTFSTSNGGNLTIDTGEITLRNGAEFSSETFNAGNGGELTINATESINLVGLTMDTGVNQGGLLASSGEVLSSNLEATATSGNVRITTPNLIVQDGAIIDVQSSGQGNAGSIEIVSDSILLTNSGTLSATTEDGENGGDLNITTSKLNIDGGEISIGSSGSGDAGSLKIDANSIMLDSQGVISADTQSGEGGNIILNANDIIWRGASFTTATAIGSGDGGNITINTDSLVALEDSSIIANAFMGMGGNIQIDTEGLFICQSCQVAASSELGVDGVVAKETLEPVDPNLLDVSDQPTQPQEEVTVACSSESAESVSQLTITGRGGLPKRPQETLNGRSLVEFPPDATVAETPLEAATLPAPARGWYRNSEGKVVLTAQVTGSYPYNSAIKSVDCHN